MRLFTFQERFYTKMNPKVKQLAEQAGGMVLAGSEIEKFAELIVKECCNVLQGEDIRYGGYGYNQGFLHKKIKEHFGVE